MTKRGRPRKLGVLDWETPIRIGGKLIPEYNLWTNMLGRVHGKNRPSYENCNIDPSWYSMKAFITDVSNLPNYHMALTQGWCLDKDILVRGNKTYAKDFCCFVPNEINTLLINCKATRGSLPVGVCFNKERGKFVAQITINGKIKGLGYFANAEDAFKAYKLAKENHIKCVASKLKHQIDSKVYDALQSWTVGYKD